MAGEIVAEVILELDRLKDQLKQVEKDSENSGRKAGNSLGDGVERGLAKIGGALAGFAAAVGSAFALKKVVEAASAQEDAINSLNASLAASGNFTKQASLDFQAYASSLASITTVADEVITQNAAILASLGGLSGRGLKDATKAALDLAAGLNIDVSSAFNLVAKAAEGNVGVLSRYGIRVKATGDQTRDFALALDEINRKFAGLAEAKVNTFSGAILQLRNNFGEILEELGNFVIRSPLVIGVIKRLSGAFVESVDAINKSGGVDVIGNLARNLVQFAQQIAPVVLPPIELLINSLGSLGIVLGGIAAAAVQAASGEFGQAFDTLKQSIADAQAKLFDFSGTAASETFLQNTREFVDSFKTTLNEMPTAMRNVSDEVSNEARRLATTLNKLIGDTVPAVVSAGVQSMGASLIQGGRAFGDFRKTALNLVGDMSIRMGQAMLAQAGLFAAFAALISNPFTAPAALIGFGLALIALGGVLKAAAGGGGGGASGPSAAAAGAPGIEAGGGLVGAQAEALDERPVTQVTLNVQGNVLDRRETGLAIIDVLNEAGFGQGAAVVTAR